MCADYRQLNDVTIKNKYPLPRIDDLFDQLSGAKVFSKIDLRTGYHQLKIKKEDIPKTAFTTRYDLYEYTIMSFGSPTPLPSSCIWWIRCLWISWTNLWWCSSMTSSFIPKSEDEHKDHLRAVLQRLREHQLYAKFSKCEFWLKQVGFLGHVLSVEGIAVDPSKVKD